MMDWEDGAEENDEEEEEAGCVERSVHMGRIGQQRTREKPSHE